MDMPRSFDSLLTISCFDGSHHTQGNRVKVNRVLHFFSFPADLRYLYPSCNARKRRLFLPWRFSFYCVDEMRKKVKHAVVRLYMHVQHRSTTSQKLPNDE